MSETTERSRRCRRCKRLERDHGPNTECLEPATYFPCSGVPHFLPHASKRLAASTSFSSGEVKIINQLVRNAMLGQPLSSQLVRTEDFRGVAAKATAMLKTISRVEAQNKIGETSNDEKVA